MIAKYLIIIVCLLINSVCFSQTRDSNICNRQNSRIDTTITVFIKGKKGKKNIKWKFFYKKFELTLSDPSYEIISFHMVWDVRRKDFIVERIVNGNIVTPDIEDTGKPDRDNYSLKNIEPGVIITFEQIRIRKDGECYLIRPLLIYTIL